MCVDSTRQLTRILLLLKYLIGIFSAEIYSNQGFYTIFPYFWLCWFPSSSSQHLNLQVVLQPCPVPNFILNIFSRYCFVIQG